MSNNDLTKKALVNTYYDSSTKKLYQVNSDGTQGGEITDFSVGTKISGNATGLSVDLALPSGFTQDNTMIISTSVNKKYSMSYSMGGVTVYGANVLYNLIINSNNHITANISSSADSDGLVEILIVKLS